jgi:hypothetical protein
VFAKVLATALPAILVKITKEEVISLTWELSIKMLLRKEMAT